MSKTQVTGNNILSKSIARADVNIASTGLALITKIILGTGLTMTSTGVDAGTGDVTLTSATAGVTSAVTSVFGRIGPVVKATGDYNFADLSGLLTGTQLPSFTGDASTSAFVTSLTTVNPNIGTFTSCTVNAKGLVTAAFLYQLIATALFSTSLSGYADGTSYYGLTASANGWLNYGSVTGQKFGLTGNQRFVNGSGTGQFNRYWDSTNLVWKTFIRTIESADFTAKGVVVIGSGVGAATSLVPGSDGLALTASAAAATGVAWAAVPVAAGGTGATTAAAALINLGGAAINSPVFTGYPTCPTAAVGDISQSFANTLFIQQAMNGSYTLSLTNGSNTTLTPAQYLVPVIILTGNITTDTSIYFPNTGSWSVYNAATTPANVKLETARITLQTVSGTGVTIAYGATKAIVADGTNVRYSNTDFTGITLPAMTTGQQLLSNTDTHCGGGLSNVTASTQGNLVFISYGNDPPMCSSVHLVNSAVATFYYSKILGGRSSFCQKDLDDYSAYYSLVWSYQPSMSNTRASYWAHAGNSVLLTAPTVTTFGFNMITVGTAVARNVTGASFINQNKRLGLVSTTTAFSSVEIYNNTAQWFTGSVNQTFRIGGFYFACKCIINDPAAVTGGNTFIGLTSITGPLANPGTFANLASSSQIIGLMCDTTDTSFKVGSTTNAVLVTTPLTASCTGTAFNGQTICDVRFYSPSGLSPIYYYVKFDNYSAGVINNIFTGKFTTTIASTYLFTPRIFRGNGNNTTAVGIDIISLYIETLY